MSSLAWAGHLIHVAIPESRGIHVGWDNFLSTPPHPSGLLPFFTGNWGAYAQNPDTPAHIFNSSQGAGTAILTFLGGFNPQTSSLWLTDMAITIGNLSTPINDSPLVRAFINNLPAYRQRLTPFMRGL